MRLVRIMMAMAIFGSANGTLLAQQDEQITQPTYYAAPGGSVPGSACS